MTRRISLPFVIMALFLGNVALAQNPGTKPPIDPDHAAKMARGLDLFKKQVRSVLVESCLKCHGGKKTEGGLDLSDRDHLLKGGESGPAILLGRGRESLLYKVSAHLKEPHMPHQGRKLPEASTAALSTWIDLGAPYDTPLVTRVATADWTRTVVPREARDWWAFRPLRRPDLPEVRHSAWVRTPVDRFILHQLEAAGLAPSPSVDRRRLLRRAAFDLTGLPPSPEEVDRFVNAADSEALSRRLDAFLDSPHYGERWARHWLDLARFGESHGFEHDYDRPTAYHYRDFVIRAFNQGMPFDQFLKWQIAGDEYAPENPLALTATGFLAAGVHSTQITKSEVERHRYEELDDKLSTIGTAFLGLTLGCARCHDHKYDPIPAGDYYRLLSAFTTTVRSEVDVDFNPGAYQAARQAFDKAHAPLEAAVRRWEETRLAERFAAWEKSEATKLAPASWAILDLKDTHSQGGATLRPLGDGSLLVEGKNPPREMLTLTAITHLRGIRAIRLEALSHPSLAKGGPGRASNGNFALTEFRVTMAPLGPDGKAQGTPQPVALRRPRATFEQKGLPAAAILDADPNSGWAVDPQFGKAHAVAVETETPLGFDQGTVLTFTLRFHLNTQHGIGRPRLAVSTQEGEVALNAEGRSGPVLEALARPVDQRTPAQTQALHAWFRQRDPEWQDLNKRVQEHLKSAPKPSSVKALICSEGLPPIRLHSQGADFLEATHYLRRGDPNQKEGIATPGYLQILMPGPEAASRWRQDPPQGGRTSYRRRALAEWLTDVEHGAGALVARVLVNRLWQRHMGRGLVASVNDFGLRGDKPTHPELLDWLATELIRNGWQIKPIHKLILQSATYAQESVGGPSHLAIDRDNRLWWRRPVRRLEGEAIRDALLSVGGLLEDRLYGPGTLDESSRRRSIYFTVKRSKLIPMLQVFDAPDALSSIGERGTTTVAPQALYLLNNPQVRASAQGLARRAASAKVTPEEAIRASYRIAFGRSPDANELAAALAFLGSQEASYSGPEGRERALTDFCQTLLCLNEFVYID